MQTGSSTSIASKGGLARRLLRSNLQLAVSGVVVIIFLAGTTSLLRNHLKRLAEVEGPMVQVSHQLASSVSLSLADLRGRLAVGDPSRAVERKTGWSERTSSLINQMDALCMASADAVGIAEVKELDTLLFQLRALQWEVEDVAQSPGNDLGQDLYERQVRELWHASVQACRDLSASEAQRSDGGRSSILLPLFEIQFSLSLVENHLLEFLRDGTQSARWRFDWQAAEGDRVLASLKSMSSQLAFDQLDLLEKLELEFSGYQIVANASLDARSRLGWNVAQHLLATRGVDLEGRIRDLTTALSERQTTQMREQSDDGARLGMLSLVFTLTITCLLVMLSLKLARANAAEIIDPIVSLVEATERVASGGHIQDVPVLRDDEVGLLTVSFNAMQRQIAESERALKREAWLKSHEATFSQLLAGDLGLEDIASKALGFLAETLQLTSGVLFHRDCDDLVACGSTVGASGANSEQSYALGEGLVGRVAATGVPVFMEESPGGPIDDDSGTVERTSASLATYPVGSGGDVVGVLRLGYLGGFDEQQIEFLSRVASLLATPLTAAAAREQHVLLNHINDQAKELLLQQDRLQDRNVELQDQKHALVLSSKYKSEFLANMSHELRTPLNSMLILSNYLAENEDGNLNESEAEAATIVHKDGGELLTLINDILDLSKVEAGMLEVVVEPIQVDSLLGGVRRQLTPGADQKGLDLKVDVDPDCCKLIHSDSQRLRQILRNLVGNAVKFTEEGSVCMSASMLTDAEGAELLEGTGPVLAFRVSDTGVGIPEDSQEQIFEAFQQADGSITRSHGGTGLGLTISTQLANLLGGVLRLESSSPSGSTFTLYLPVEAPLLA